MVEMNFFLLAALTLLILPPLEDAFYLLFKHNQLWHNFFPFYSETGMKKIKYSYKKRIAGLITIASNPKYETILTAAKTRNRDFKGDDITHNAKYQHKQPKKNNLI